VRRLVYNVRFFEVPINSSLLIVTLHSSVISTLVYNDTKYSVPFMTFQQSSTALWQCSFLFVKTYWRTGGVPYCATYCVIQRNNYVVLPYLLVRSDNTTIFLDWRVIKQSQVTAWTFELRLPSPHSPDDMTHVIHNVFSSSMSFEGHYICCMFSSG
jgi:hypothetical protein